MGLSRGSDVIQSDKMDNDTTDKDNRNVKNEFM